MPTRVRHMQENDPMPIGQAVALLQTQFPDVSHSSLRFLEREGLLAATRTTGGHRLYSQEDLERVISIKRWQRDGSSLQDIRDRLALRAELQDTKRLASEFLRIVLDNRLEEAERMVIDADRAGVPPQAIFFEVLQPALVVVGHRWASGELAVFQEKEVSEVCRELVIEITLRHAPDFADGPLLIAACVEGERHEIGLRMVYGLLRQQGFRVRYLGADVATAFLVSAVQANRPDAVLLSSSVAASFAGCFAALDAIRSIDLENPPLVVVGGEIALMQADELRSLGAVPVQDADILGSLDDLLKQRKDAA